MAVTDGLGDLYELLGVRPRRQRRGDQAGLPGPRPRAAPRHQPGRPRGRGPLQGGDGRLRGAARPRAPGPLRPLRARGRLRLAGRRRRGFGFEGGLGDIFEAFFGQMAGGGGSRRRGPQAGGRRRGAARPRVRRGRLRLPQGDLGPPAGPVRDLRRPGHGAGHRAGDLRRLPGHRRAAPGAPVAAGPGGDQRRLLALQRDRRDDPAPVRRLPGRGPPHGGEHVHRRGARRRRGRGRRCAWPTGVRPASGAARAARSSSTSPSPPTPASSARATTCTPR